MDLGKSYEDISKGFQELLTPRHQGPPEPDSDTQNGHLPGYACPPPGSENPASRTGSSFATGRTMQRCISDNVARLLLQEAGGRVQLLGKRHPAVCRPPLYTLLPCSRGPVFRSRRTFCVKKTASLELTFALVSSTARIEVRRLTQRRSCGSDLETLHASGAAVGNWITQRASPWASRQASSRQGASPSHPPRS